VKSAYELAMERLAKASPAVKLSAAQKKQIAELDSKYKAKLAEREIVLKDEIARLAAAGDFEKTQAAERLLAVETKKLQDELEEKKEQVRQGKP
jgi:hypothetical protein